MANQPRRDRETHENGIAHEMGFESTIKKVERYPVLQGFILLGIGTVLILFSVGFFPIIKWAIFAAGVVLAVYGAYKANLPEKIAKIYENIRKRF